MMIAGITSGSPRTARTVRALSQVVDGGAEAPQPAPKAVFTNGQVLAAPKLARRCPVRTARPRLITQHLASGIPPAVLRQRLLNVRTVALHVDLLRFGGDQHIRAGDVRRAILQTRLAEDALDTDPPRAQPLDGGPLHGESAWVNVGGLALEVVADGRLYP